MAQKVQVILTDDIDGGDATETVEFALDSVGYVIDLSESNTKALRDALAPFIAAGRREGKVRPTVRNTAPRSNGAAPARARGDLSVVRAWARENGFDVSDRGRVSGEVKAAYEAANA